MIVRRWGAALGAAVLLLTACNVPPAAREGTPVPTASEAYCTEQGGRLVHRHAVWNTNADPSAWLEPVSYTHLTLPTTSRV